VLAGAKTTCFILLLGAGVLVSGSSPLPNDVERVLHASWRSYCRQHIQANGRVALGAQEREAGSETQAGVLLRAVAAGDAATFARVYAWTRINLSRRERPGGALLARRWGLEADGAGVILEDDTDAAADLDYALALALAARRGWKPPASQPDYGAEARQVARDILRQDVVILPSGEALLLPGTDAPRQSPYLIKPSDFSPAAFRLLSQLEPDPR
jgi:endo-1,4-beta-D-glucanase Y